MHELECIIREQIWANLPGTLVMRQQAFVWLRGPAPFSASLCVTPFLGFNDTWFMNHINNRSAQAWNFSISQQQPVPLHTPALPSINGVLSECEPSSRCLCICLACTIITWTLAELIFTFSLCDGPLQKKERTRKKGKLEGGGGSDSVVAESEIKENGPKRQGFRCRESNCDKQKR